MESFVYGVAFRKAGWGVAARGDVKGKSCPKSRPLLMLRSLSL